MKIGFLYAGQGAQHVGMGKDLYEAYPEFREVFDNVKLDFDVKECCFDGPIEKLGQTRYTQPCMVAFAVGVTKILAAKGIVPEIAAGLSLGEYSALYAAGVFEEQQVIDLVAYRGKSMEETVPKVKGAADVEIVGLMVSLDRMEVGKGGVKCALDEVHDLYGFETNAIVTMKEVIEHLYNKEYKGKVIIDDTLKAAIDAYYEQYGAK